MHVLSLRWFALLLGAAFLLVSAAPAQKAPQPSADQIAKWLESLQPKTGTILLGSGLATVKVPDSFGYLDAAQSHTLLEKIWGNPPGPDALGMLVPKGFNPLSEDSWAVTIRFEPEGYVKDDDAEKINYQDLLKQMQEGTREANKEREARGYPPLELVGWAAPPRYDKAAKKLYWAKELKFGGSTEHTLNYNIRILGRRGYLVLNAIGGMSQLKNIESASPQLLAMVDFNEGHRYADFNASTDKIAEYGIAGLVAGGVAAKLGFFKWLWVALLSMKKLLVMIVVALGAGLVKLFSWLTGGSRRRIGEGEPPAA
ncbi:MAG: DUF2167 domain-containing protein [Verrucomicrobia bacterium]|nr:DUF2167 domain-containing protein [Verrucomicrobiota bacterium]